MVGRKRKLTKPPAALKTIKDDVDEEEDCSVTKVPTTVRKAQVKLTGKESGGSRKTTPLKKVQRRRQASKKLKIEDDAEEDEDEETRVPTTRKAQSGGSQKTTTLKNVQRRHHISKKLNIEDDEEEEEDEETKDSPYQSDGEHDGNPKSATTLTTKNSKKCPHCEQTFGTIAGAKYHIDHLVCQPAERLPRKKRSKSETRKPKVRGTLSDRTCTNCQRVFTSVNGLAYHRGKCKSTCKRIFYILLWSIVVFVRRLTCHFPLWLTL